MNPLPDNARTCNEELDTKGASLGEFLLDGDDADLGHFAFTGEIYVVRNQRRIGPFSPEQAADMLRHGILDREDLAGYQGHDSLIPLGMLLSTLAPHVNNTGFEADVGIDASLEIREIYVEHEGRRTGPYNVTQALRLMQNGMLSKDDMATYRGSVASMPLFQLLKSVHRAMGAPMPMEEVKGEEPHPIERALVPVTDPVRLPARLGGRRGIFALAVLITVLIAASAAVYLLVPAARTRIRTVLGNLSGDSANSHRGYKVHGANGAELLLIENLAKLLDMPAADEAVFIAHDLGSQTEESLKTPSRGREYAVAMDAVVVVAHPSSRRSIIDLDDLRHMLQGSDKATRRASAHLYVAGDLFSSEGSIHPLLSLNSENPLMTMAAPRDVAKAVTDNPEVLGLLRLADARGTKILAVREKGAEPVLPTKLSVLTEEYSLSRRVSLFLPGHADNDDFDISARLGSTEARSLITSTGFLPRDMFLRHSPILWNAPTRYRSLLLSARRLPVNVRIDDENADLTSASKHDLDRVAAFLHGKNLEVMAVGFSGSKSGGGGKTASSLDAERTAAYLRKQGVSVAEAWGVGSIHFVASPYSSQRDATNRRVELWAIAQ
ncbi:MAG: hypothetical protein GF344_02570 [Chitinivibrionales bacterium]|nr:hypothetical protein [Chitinivibrionales bacterium]MBD3355970.1 hypothetical protein [Chitinivibrionales bacterium]